MTRKSFARLPTPAHGRHFLAQAGLCVRLQTRLQCKVPPTYYFSHSVTQNF